MRSWYHPNSVGAICANPQAACIGAFRSGLLKFVHPLCSGRNFTYQTQAGFQQCSASLYALPIGYFLPSTLLTIYCRYYSMAVKVFQANFAFNHFFAPISALLAHLELAHTPRASKKIMPYKMTGQYDWNPCEYEEGSKIR